MVVSKRARATILELKERVPDQLHVGTVFSLKVRVICDCGCDHSGAPYSLVQTDDVQAAGILATQSGDHETAEISAVAPDRIGKFQMTFVVPAHEVGGVPHAEASLRVSLTTWPHGLSLVAWDNPSPVVIGETFYVKAGARCTAACVLTGEPIDIYDEAGSRIASGFLGDSPWPGTRALYWTAVELIAPSELGVFSWSLPVAAAERRNPCSPSSAFSFVTVPPPEHMLSVRVVEKGTDTPIAGVHVRLGSYRASTDATGLATCAVSSGEHKLVIGKPGYSVETRAIAVHGNEHLQVEATRLAERNPDAHWRG